MPWEHDRSRMEEFARHYAAECSKVSTLGRNISVGGDNFLRADAAIDSGVPITAFPLHALVNRDTMERYEAPEFQRAQVASPLDVDGLAKHHSWAHPGMPGCAAIFHPEVPIRLDSAAHLVKVVENPYDGVRTENVDALAHTTARYLERIAHSCNCTPAYSERTSQPFAMVSLRRIAAGEELLSARSPLYFLYDDTELAEKIVDALAEMPTGLSRGQLREMVGLTTS